MTSTAGITEAVRALLAADAELVALVGGEVGQPWIMRGDAQLVVEGTGEAAVSIRCVGNWRGPTGHNTMRFPRLIISVWVDPTRDASGCQAQASDAVEDRGRAIFDIVSRILHRPAGKSFQSNGTTIVSCLMLSEPDYRTVEGGSGLRAGEASFGLSAV